tara:strand:- start:421 stop:774 length:354 start_codon:yes stop_codon:yes gene_type:complete
MEEFRKFFADYLLIRSHAVGDFATSSYKKEIAAGLKDLSDFVAAQSPDHPTLSVIDGLWDYLVDESIGALFDHILETVPVGADMNAFLTGLSGTLLEDVLTFSRPDICGHGEGGLSE